MADQRIGELPDGGQPTDLDDAPIERSNANYRWRWSNVRAWLEARFAPLSHVGAGGAEHADATGGASGFMSAADKTKLDGVADNANDYAHPNHTGDVTSVGDGAQTIANNVVTNVKLVDMPANTVKARPTTSGNPQDLSEAGAADLGAFASGDGLLGWKQGGVLGRFTSMPGGGGGGIGKGTPFVIGDLMEASDDAGDGQARTTGIQSTAVSSHIASTSNPHSVTAAQLGAMTALLDDTLPILGGNLQTKGAYTYFTRADDSLHGIALAIETSPGAALAYTADGSYDTANGAVTVEPSMVRLFGTAIIVDGLQHGDTEAHDVRVAASGQLIAVPLPPPGWSDEKTSTADLSLGTGATTGPWSPAPPAPGLFRHDIAADLAAGDLITITSTVYVVHGKDGDPNVLHDKTTSIEIGFGVNGSTPIAGEQKLSIGPYFSGRVSFTFQAVLGSPITTTDKLDVYFRRGGGDDSSSNPWIYYTAAGGLAHDSILSRPSEGGGGSGDMLSPASMAIGELYSAADTGGVQTQATGIQATDVARRSVSNTFVGINTFSDRVDIPGRVLTVTGAAPICVLEDTGGTSGDRAAWFRIQNETLDLTAVADGPGYSPGAAAMNVSLADSKVTFPATPELLRSDASQTIGENGYPATPTELTPAANTITPSLAGNGSYRVAAAHADVLTIDMSGETGEGAFSLLIPAGTTGRTLSPAATVTEGTPTASVAQWLYWERVGTSTLAVWLGA